MRAISYIVAGLRPTFSIQLPLFGEYWLLANCASRVSRESRVVPWPTELGRLGYRSLFIEAPP